MNTEPVLDLDAYLARIDYSGGRTPTAAVLDAIHFAHATTVPFENLDIFLGLPIRIDMASIQAKLVQARRGGYCFEQNTLFAAVLERLGFRVTGMAARVRVGSLRVLPRMHMMLKVEAEGQLWLADVGFGTGGLLRPIPLRPDVEWRQSCWRYRLVREGELWVLQSLKPEGWLDLYAFTEEPQHPVDYEMPNHYASTHPNSRFVQTLTAQRTTPDARYRLVNRELTITRAEGEKVHVLSSEGELRGVLAETFGLSFPATTRFRSPLGHSPFEANA